MGGGTTHVHLSVITPIKKTSSSALPHSTLSSSSANLNTPVSANGGKLEAIHGNGKEDMIKASGSFPQSVFGPVPSQSEVQMAISLLHNFMQALSSRGSDSKWLVEMFDGGVPRILLSYGLRRLYNAFQLLQTDTCVKRLVVSLSSDKALWDAIMNNELVRKLGEPLCSAETERQQIRSKEPEVVATILKWIWDMTKAKVMELIGKFLSLMNEMDNPGEEKSEDQLEDKVRSSLLLSVVILLIVVVARAN
ncbi:hypothetical protein PanWU01x14_147860 [Parasponia andersonii]|uniref:Uncharacterized protein n=1 Tax=Parasponia andersonii TaxID=3476 RepID=A0A2P5CJK4_PARAD|nr:hypothetical protein PanWU01x14_147860 [Parasponia andersonii]